MTCNSTTRTTMGMDFGLQDNNICLPLQNRWLLEINGVSADPMASQGVNCLPPKKSARPSFGFKEMEVKHLTETIYYPIRPEWKPLDLVLYDFRGNKSPVFKWLENLYQPEKAIWSPILNEASGFYRTATLNLYSGCGEVLETWIYENCWPKDIDWGELDMGQHEIITCKLTLRYTRAYLCKPNNDNQQQQ